MKKIVLIPALVMFAAAPALAQNTPAGTINSDMGREQSQLDGAKDSQKGTKTGRDAAEPMAPSQISGSQSDKTGATPTDENRDDIKKPAK